jgi:hypothetical protein
MQKLLTGSLLALLLSAGSIPLFETTAQAQVAVIRIQTAPPAMRLEAMSPAPSPRHFFVAGHWAWDGRIGQHVWQPGRWELIRPNQHWYPARWISEGGTFYRYIPGHWGPPPQLPPTEVIEVQAAPPPPQQEVIAVAPSPQHFWVGGHWRWDGAIRRHVWVGGHWELQRTAQVWEPAHWAHGPWGWRYLPGHWRAY